MKIGVGLPGLARKQLKACLWENTDLFTWSDAEILVLNTKVSCHQLAVDPAARVVVQHRRRQSPEQVEAIEKAVKDLLKENFICEAQNRTWL